MLFKNRSGVDLDLPTLGLLGIAPNATVEVTGDDAQDLLRNDDFERVDEPVRRASHTDDDEEQS